MVTRDVTRDRDGRSWRIGDSSMVAWIADGVSAGRTIGAAIPPLFEAYATIDLPPGGDGQAGHDRAVVELLSAASPEQPWWLGYLDTGADDIVFPDAPKLKLYAGWPYVLVEAGPEQAGSWRRSDGAPFWLGVLPNLIFPADHSWLLSALWDDDWTCVGGSAGLVAAFVRHPGLRARQITDLREFLGDLR